MSYIDLSHPFKKDMPVYPGAQKPIFQQMTSFEKQTYVCHQVTMGLHVGTHIDAPMHMIPDGKALIDYPIERFVGPGHLIDARDREVIDVDVLQDHDIAPNDIVLFFTGFSEYFRDADYFKQHPVMTEALVQQLIALQIKMVGVDTASPDNYPYPLHRLLLGKDILIIENLTNLEALLNQPEFKVFALPIHFEAEASPVRVVAEIP